MERRKGILQGGLIYGSIAAAFYILGFLALYFADRNPITEGKYLFFILTPALGFFMLRIFREQWNGGLLHFWEGMSMAFVFGAIAAILIGFFTYAFLQWIDTDLMGKTITFMLEQVEAQKEQYISQFGDEVLYQEQLAATKETTPRIMFLDSLAKVFPISLMSISFITIFMRKTEKR